MHWQVWSSLNLERIKEWKYLSSISVASCHLVQFLQARENWPSLHSTLGAECYWNLASYDLFRNYDETNPDLMLKKLLLLSKIAELLCKYWSVNTIFAFFCILSLCSVFYGGYAGCPAIENNMVYLHLLLCLASDVPALGIITRHLSWYLAHVCSWIHAFC